MSLRLILTDNHIIAICISWLLCTSLQWHDFNLLLRIAGNIGSNYIWHKCTIKNIDIKCWGCMSSVRCLIWWVEIYEANSPWIGCLYHNDVCKSLLLGLKNILHKDLSPSQFIWLHLAGKPYIVKECTITYHTVWNFGKEEVWWVWKFPVTRQTKTIQTSTYL